ncbi:MAG: T9SS type A sorting domain-containing protein, partial [Bacteroidetes bacterium]|nr:T9SS type A sorting domain-containing protein [Bacteroidota bacterium]MBL7812905.1 T9SS type A sorting domain-containing protein [Bacteroidota bacterium]
QYGSGIYLIRLTNNGQTATRRIEVQR